MNRSCEHLQSQALLAHFVGTVAMKIGSFVVGSLSAGKEGTMKVVTHPGLSASEGSD